MSYRRMTAILIVSMLLLVGATSIPIRGKQVELTKANEKEIRSVLNDDHRLDRDALSKSNGLSQLALPLYGRILDNPDSDAHLVVRTLFVLRASGKYDPYGVMAAVL